MAMSLGLFTLNINQTIGAVKLQWSVVPLIFSLLLSQKRISDIQVMLLSFYTVMRHQDDLTGLTWYYAMCLDVLLDTGVTIRSFIECRTFYTNKFDQLPLQGDNEAIARLYANLCLFCARTNRWHFTSIFKSTKFESSKHKTCVNILTDLRVLETKILNIMRMIETRNMDGVKRLKDEIRLLEGNIKEALKISKFYTARFNLLDTYFYQIVSFSEENVSFMEEIKRISLETGSFIVHDMAHHNLLVEVAFVLLELYLKFFRVGLVSCPKTMRKYG